MNVPAITESPQSTRKINPTNTLQFTPYTTRSHLTLHRLLVILLAYRCNTFVPTFAGVV